VGAPLRSGEFARSGHRHADGDRSDTDTNVNADADGYLFSNADRHTDADWNRTDYPDADCYVVTCWRCGGNRC